jgi:hypothetical protein
MHDAAAVISALAQAGWVAIVGYFLFKFQLPLSNVLGRLSKFRLRLPDGTEVEATAYEAAAIAQQLLDEVDQNLIHGITTDERKLLAFVVSHAAEPTVGEAVKQVFGKDFVRESHEHNVLRKLRDRQLLRPRGGDQFQREKHLEVKPFGRILLRVRRSMLLGEAKSAEPGAAPDPAPKAGPGR